MSFVCNEQYDKCIKPIDRQNSTTYTAADSFHLLIGLSFATLISHLTACTHLSSGNLLGYIVTRFATIRIACVCFGDFQLKCFEDSSIACLGTLLHFIDFSFLNMNYSYYLATIIRINPIEPLKSYRIQSDIQISINY